MITFVAKTYEIGTLQSWENLDEKTALLMGTGIYTTAFNVSPQQMEAANGGFKIDLGDVRESARVYLNDIYVGCAWCAPFILDLRNLVKEGENTLRIEVTNLPANRIRPRFVDAGDDLGVVHLEGGDQAHRLPALLLLHRCFLYWFSKARNIRSWSA